MRCGGDWRRDYGGFYTGTKGETPATAKELPTDYRASSRPYRVQRGIRDHDTLPDEQLANLGEAQAITEPALYIGALLDTPRPPVAARATGHRVQRRST